MPVTTTGGIAFYHYPQSRAAIVHWMLEEVGADYEIRPIDLRKGENRTPEFLAVNPMGKLPTIVVDGAVITEAAAIVAWLADAHPDAGLSPPLGSVERGTWYRWLFFGGSCIEPAMADAMFKRPPVAQRGALGWGSIEEVIAAVEAALRPGPWLLGDRFSAADVYIGAEFSWAEMFGLPQLLQSSVIKAYIARCRERPAYARTMGAR